MFKATKPSKAEVRAFMNRPRTKDPLPSPQEIRRMLGWNLVAENGQVPEVPRTA